MSSTVALLPSLVAPVLHEAGGYQPDLPMTALIDRLRSLRARQRVIDRLVCRYLADLADRIEQRNAVVGLGGYADIFEVSEGLLGLGVRATRERVRIGRALRHLPRIERAFEQGELGFTRVREITRIARPESEREWLELGSTLPQRALERRVAEAGGGSGLAASVLAAGDGPGRLGATPTQTAPANTQVDAAAARPDLVRVVLDLPAADWILLQKALETVRTRTHRTLNDAEAIVALAGDVLTSRRVTAGDRRTDDFQLDGRDGAADEDDDPTGSPEGAANEDGDPMGSCAMAASGGDASVSTESGFVEPDPADGDGDERDAMWRCAATLLQQMVTRPRWHVDQLCEATGLAVSPVLAALLNLELDGAVYREPGGYYVARAA
jgi:hypothetical protein